MKLKHLLKKSFLNENSINNISDISDEKIVGQNGLNYLRSVIEKLNKKSLKWKLPPLKLVILSEKNVPPKSGLYGPEKVSPILVKEYSIKIEGDSPKVEGYEFIAKIEHTPEGNIINVAPGASVKNLPESFRNVNAICDVCKQNRERFNTFVLKMEKDDKQRFPDKKRGDLIMAGSACLKRFLPGISVQSLISYAEIIDDIRNIKEDGDDENNSYDNFERGHPDRTKYHYDVSILMDYICRAYLVEGKYISKSKAFDNQTPTVEAALSSLFDKKEEYFVNVEINKNPNLKEKAKKLSEDVLNWAKTADFDAMAQNSPDFREYYLNLKVVSRSSAISYKNTGYLGGALAAYLRAQGQLEKKKAETKAPSQYVGTVGEKITFNGTLKKQHSYDSNWGRVYMYHFVDDSNNDIIWWSSNDIGLEDDKKYSVTAKVKKQEPNKYTQRPQTVIKNAKVNPL